MYLAAFDMEGQGLVQARVFIPHGAMASMVTWRALVDPVVHGVMAGSGLWLSIRARAGNRACEKVLTVTAPARQADSARRLVAAFTRVGRVAGSQVSVPRDAAGHDRLAANIPPWRSRITCSGFHRNGYWFACNFQLFPALDQFMAAACAAGIKVGWQANLAPFEPAGDLIKQARRNCLYIRGLPGSPPALAQWQEQLALHLPRCRYLLEEYLAVERAGVAWATDWLGNHFASQYRRFGFATPTFSFETGDNDSGQGISDAELDLGIHSLSTRHDPVPVDEACGSAVEVETGAAVMDWGPGPQLKTVLAAAALDGNGDDEPRGPDGRRPPPPPPVQPAGEPPPPYLGSQPFSFVSYAHADFSSIAPVMSQLTSVGLNLWWDRGLPPGGDWLACLEDRIRASRAVILMLSQRSIDSRWCRSEVLLAHTENKLVLPICLEPAELRHGMKLLIGHTQMIDPRTAGFIDRLREMLR
jgi:hypothetical protein